MGDAILEIDGQKAENIAYLIALSRLNQSEGMEVNLTVARGNVEDATPGGAESFGKRDLFET